MSAPKLDEAWLKQHVWPRFSRVLRSDRIYLARLESTPPVLTPFQALAGLELTLELGVERIREYNLSQKRFLASTIDVEGAGEDHRRLRHRETPECQKSRSRAGARSR